MKLRKIFKCAMLSCSLLSLLASGVAAAGPKKIPFTALEGVQVGNAQNDAGKTGVTVLYFCDTAKTGVHISGGGPASRETPVLDPTKEDIGINAIVLGGGSAYGLAALKGNQPVSGSVGAGTGATVGKICGMRQSMKAGIGYYAVQVGELKVGAVVVVNALGDIFSAKDGRKLAGLLNKERTAFMNSAQELYRLSAPKDLYSRTNTTIGAIVTNGRFDKAQLTRIAAQATNAYARCINPVGTLADGDTIYASSCGKQVPADVNMVGALAAEVMAQAIEDAVQASKMNDEEYLRYCL